MTGTRTIIGCMSGTSMDGVDAALVRVNGHGLSAECSFERLSSATLGEADLLRRLAGGHALAAHEIMRARAALCESHLEAIRGLEYRGGVDLIVCHGQTVFHKPPLSWQLFDPWPIVAECKTTVLSDLRSPDLAMGGQGAPITPLADWVLFRSSTRTRAVVNLGGFVNVTRIDTQDASPTDGLAAFDVCPCNHLLDALARERLELRFDHAGETALAGSIDVHVATEISQRLATPSVRSLGTGDEHSQMVVQRTAALGPADALATACAAIASCIADAVKHTEEVVLAGGSVQNRRLVNEIAERCSGRVTSSDELGVPVQAREAVCMAVLGALSQDGLPIHLPGVTNARQTIAAGSWSRP